MLTDKERAIIVDLINIAWKAGAVTAPAQAQQVEDLRVKIIEMKPKEEEKNGNVIELKDGRKK